MTWNSDNDNFLFILTDKTKHSLQYLISSNWSNINTFEIYFGFLKSFVWSAMIYDAGDRISQFFDNRRLGQRVN